MKRETRATGMQQEVAVTNRRHTLFILAIRSSSVSIYEALTKRTRSSNTDLYWKNQIQSNLCYAAIRIKEWSYGAITEVCFLIRVHRNLTKEKVGVNVDLGEG